MKNFIYILLISLSFHSCASYEYTKADLKGTWTNEQITITFEQRKVHFNDDFDNEYKYNFHNGQGLVHFENHSQEFELLSNDFMKYGEYFLNKE